MRALLASLALAVLAGLIPIVTDAVQLEGSAASGRYFSEPALQVGPALEIYEIGAVGALKLNRVSELFAASSDQWEVRWDARSDRPHLIQGAGIPLLPGRGNGLIAEKLGLDDEIGLAAVEALLRDFMAEHQDLLGIEGIDLRLDPERSFAFGDDGFYWTIELQQYHQGVPVDNAYVFFRINHGNIIQLGTNRVAEVGIDATAELTREQALRKGLVSVGIAEPPLSFEDSGSLRLFPAMGDTEALGKRFQGERGKGYQHRLCWQYVLSFPGDDHRYRLRVDAKSGEVLEYLDLTSYAEVRGDVYPVTNSDLLESVGLPFLSVTNNGITKTTNADGEYSFSPGTATASLSGPYAAIIDMCGAISLSNSTDGTIDFGGATSTDCGTPGYGGSGNTNAARTAFFHVNNIHRKAASYLPGNSWLDSQVYVVTNDDGECNACWSGSAMHFLRSGWSSALGTYCTNPGEISDALFHEWGHAMDEHSGGPAAERGSGEALADTFGLLENRDGCMGEGFTPSLSCHNCRSSCTGMRDLDAFASGGISTIARPSTIADDNGINCDRFACPFTTNSVPYAGPMGYEGHCESYIASTANYDLAQLLIAEHGSAAGWATMARIWWGSITPAQSAYRVTSGGTCNPSATVDGCGATNWYTVYLSIDDDDGNLANGTPNACRIWDAFDAHGIACGSRPACSGSCGNGIIDAGEVCDGSNLGGETCQSLGYDGGTLACATGCAGFDVSGCEVPIIGLSTTSIQRSVVEGQSPSNDSFTVSNIGEGTLQYTIIDDAGWLAVSPASGASTGEADTIVISYSTAALAPGTYQATIRVIDGLASNSPRSLGVQVVVTQAPTITVTSPTFHQEYATGQQLPISWQSERLTGNVSISLCPTDGSPCFPLTTLAYDSSPYSYTISGVAAGEYRVLVEQGSISDTSPRFAIDRHYPEAVIVTDPSPAIGEGSLEVSFNGSSSYDPDGSIVTYQWDFENNGSVDAGGPIVSHLYTTSATARLRVIDNDGLADSATVLISLYEPGPYTLYPTVVPSVADWTQESAVIGEYDGDKAEGAPTGTTLLTATDFDSWVLPPGRSITRVECGVLARFTDGVSGKIKIAAHGQEAWMTLGTVWTWRSIDMTSLEASWTKQEVDALEVGVRRAYIDDPPVNLRVGAIRLVISTNEYPTAVINAVPTLGDAPLAVSFNASGSTDTDGSIVSYQWDFNNDGTIDASGITASHTYTVAGGYTARLIVTDDQGWSDEATVAITATQAGPVAYVLYPTAVPNVADWTQESAVIGAYDGDKAEGAPTGTTYLRATDFDSWILPPGKSITKVEYGVLARFTDGVVGKARMREFTHSEAERWITFRSAWDWLYFDVTALEASWTKEEVDALQVGIRRAYTSDPAVNLRVGGILLRVTVE